MFGVEMDINMVILNNGFEIITFSITRALTYFSRSIPYFNPEKFLRNVSSESKFDNFIDNLSIVDVVTDIFIDKC